MNRKAKFILCGLFYLVVIAFLVVKAVRSSDEWYIGVLSMACVAIIHGGAYLFQLFFGD